LHALLSKFLASKNVTKMVTAMITDQEPTPIRKAQGKPFDRKIDWSLVGLLAGTFASGIVLGVSVALLTAPQSGEQTRRVIGDGFRRHKPWKQRSPWDQLGAELTRAARRRNRRLENEERGEAYA